MAVSFPSFQAPIPALYYPHLSILLSVIGLLFLGWFFTLQVSYKKDAKKDMDSDNGIVGSMKRVLGEAVVAFLASFLLGFGLLFVCLNVGIYV
jgi:tellurite resistance protein TehA-like permease